MAFGFSDSHSDDHAEIMSEINITPLTDIFLVLLIIFMVTAPALIQQGPKVDLPGTSSKQKTVTGLTITLTPEKKIFVGDQEVPRGELVSVLKTELPKTSKQEVILNADKNLILSEIVSVMDLARQGGAKKLAIATRTLTTQ